VVIEGNTKIGKNNVIFPFAAIGQNPQDLKFAGEESLIEIGDNNKIREHVTIHPGTKTGAMITRVGNNCLLMVGVHIAHDCVVADHVILANNATLAGHVEVGEGAVIGGLSAMHQFVKIGKHAMIGGMSGVETDVIPYGTVMGERASLAGLNLVGLKRKGFEKDKINKLRAFYKKLFEETSGNLAQKVAILSKEYGDDELVSDVVKFIYASSRGICKPR
jgi:UDP-N-acetylglucosamine acyltransferase